MVAKPSGTLTPKGESSRIISPREAFFPPHQGDVLEAHLVEKPHPPHGIPPFLKASFSTPSAVSPA